MTKKTVPDNNDDRAALLATVKRVQAMAARIGDPSRNLVDELIAERRAEES